MKFPMHGGDLAAAAAYFGVPMNGWIDLSTGINPEPYPFRVPPLETFASMPYLDASAHAAACGYYGSDQLEVIPGSQSFIAHLPGWLENKPMLVPDVGYQEYQQAWKDAGRTVQPYSAMDAGSMVRSVEDQLALNPDQHLVVINPNNPTGVQMPLSVLDGWAKRLAPGCCLLVDEAFMDMTPDQSILQSPDRSAADLPANVLVLRSFGKFFGLAGLRIGAVVFGNQVWERWQSVRRGKSLWSLNGPAQTIAADAWRDTDWHRFARHQIPILANRMHRTLAPLMANARLQSRGGLFVSYVLPEGEASAIYEGLGREGILVRPVALSAGAEMAGNGERAVRGQAMLRFGLISASRTDSWDRLAAVVDELSQTLHATTSLTTAAAKAG
ncbi:aminotransferase class I/II-fold pyridoxal phosphate-dependent enzyme [Oceanobacter kriegii]|uniref:aminotransferase class I/II-fold pyridoxal phosphate-dependent enzyme n=1 Tax=Oceanobacter kriegii TaxID=64972 RepID=UPI00040D3038|nr:aminotransferase class I/II-fold pyridoxal phosphate-dependent enzyme [Oceanobacter kriegii]